MMMFTSKLVRDKNDPNLIVIRVPISMIRAAQIEPSSEILIRTKEHTLLVEAIQADTEWMDVHAEDFVTVHRDLFRKLCDLTEKPPVTPDVWPPPPKKEG